LKTQFIAQFIIKNFENMKNNIKNIRHIGIVVKDLEKALHFWITLMGFTVHKEMNEEGVHIDSITKIKDTKVKTVKLIGPKNSMIELLYFNDNFASDIDKKPYSYGITHIAIEVENIEEEYNRLLKEGIEFNSPPNLTPDGFAKMNYMKAHDGVYIELVEITS